MDQSESKFTHGERVEYVKGCPICEHTNPELERDLYLFAQLLFDMWLDKKGLANTDETVGVDFQQ